MAELAQRTNFERPVKVCLIEFEAIYSSLLRAFGLEGPVRIYGNSRLLSVFWMMEPYSAVTCHSLVKGSAFQLSQRIVKHELVVAASGGSSGHGAVGDMQPIISCSHIISIPTALFFRATDSV